MNCKCGGKGKCTDSRDYKAENGDEYRRRRYKCACGERFSTVEILAFYGDSPRAGTMLDVAKKLWTKQAYSKALDDYTRALEALRAAT